MLAFFINTTYCFKMDNYYFYILNSAIFDRYYVGYIDERQKDQACN
ncbi:MAG: hypothetical protein PWP52_1395 [Bacteroidales bacterium]|nr:hypothetical protein [Bacteroidales bacterium]